MTLSGSCNACGACCVAEINGRPFRCAHLQPDNSCAVYEARYNLMPIMLISASGEQRAARCGKDSAAEMRSILRVIDQCSMVRE